MKILVVIDSFGSGGAQRQIVNLAIGLLSRGHDVEAFYYVPKESFFRGILEAGGVQAHEIDKATGFSPKVVLKLVQLIRKNGYEGVISFLPSPNLYCELARIFVPRIRLIVSERSSRAADKGLLNAFLHRLLHFAAYRVIANSKTHAEWLQTIPWLKKKTQVIYNGYNIGQSLPKAAASEVRPFKYLVIGRVNDGKNGLRMIQALAMYHAKYGFSPHVSWAGRCDPDENSQLAMQQIVKLLDANPGVAANWRWLGERNDIPELLAACDALLHPSLYEGLPNVVCEAFIAACPVLISNVCDHPYLVGEGARGRLFDPNSPHSILGAIEEFEQLSVAERLKLGQNARTYAEEHLAMDRMVHQFEEVLGGV